MEFKTIRFEIPEPGIGLITLNRPERLNALSLDMVGELHALFAEVVGRKDVRVLILTGEGRGFCSGADLKDARLRQEFPTSHPDPTVHLIAIQKKYADLALASDVVIAGPKAAFTPSFINIGLSGGEMGTTFFLPQKVGSSRAAEILLTGRTVDAQEAEKIGLVSRIVEENRLLGAAMEIARAMLAKSPMGLRFTKEALNLSLTAPSLEAAIEFENRNQSMCCSTPDFFKAVEAFMKRRQG
jgi:enoyl-CoA hydratase